MNDVSRVACGVDELRVDLLLVRVVAHRSDCAFESERGQSKCGVDATTERRQRREDALAVESAHRLAKRRDEEEEEEDTESSENPPKRDPILMSGVTEVRDDLCRWTARIGFAIEHEEEADDEEAHVRDAPQCRPLRQAPSASCVLM